jgi:tight adherence protein B
MRVAEYLLARLLLAAVLFTIAVFAMRGHPASLAVAGAAGLAGYLLPALYVREAARRRVARIEKQLIEFLPGLAAALRSGFSIQQAIAAAAEQTGPPLAQELAIVVHDVGLGATTDAALLELDRRVESTDLGMVVTAVLVHRTTGGSLAELLDQAAETLRERERVRGDVLTFTAQQRLTGLVLSIYPIAVGLLLLALAPSLWSKLFTETVGQVQLGIAVGLQVLGFLAIRRALDIKV